MTDHAIVVVLVSALYSVDKCAIAHSTAVDDTQNCSQSLCRSGHPSAGQCDESFNVGDAVRSAVGSFVGLCVGACVGSSITFSFGVGVGFGVGLAVGVLVREWQMSGTSTPPSAQRYV